MTTRRGRTPSSEPAEADPVDNTTLKTSMDKRIADALMVTLQIGADVGPHSTHREQNRRTPVAASKTTIVQSTECGQGYNAVWKRKKGQATLLGPGLLSL